MDDAVCAVRLWVQAIILCALFPALAWGQAAVSVQPGSPGNGLIPQTQNDTSGFVVSSSRASLYSIAGSAGTTAPYIMVFDASAVPADGSVTPQICLGPFPASQPFSVSYAPGPPSSFKQGIAVAVSSTGCDTKTAVTVTSLTVNAQ